jgi:large subunit ribosomal protein L23
MSLFKTKKADTEGKEVKAKKVAKAPKTEKAVAIVEKSVVTPSISNAAGSILRPRITEKSGILSQTGVYTFEISSNANKNSVSSAIKALYKVVPVKVAIINNPSKNVFVKGRKGVVSGFRKALVTLKKGDKIDFV